MHKKRKILMFSISIITTVIIVCLFFLLLKIIHNKNEHTIRVLTTLENSILEKSENNISDDEITATGKSDDIVNSHFVDPTNINIFIDYLQKLVSNTGANLSVNTVTASATEKNKLLVKISIKGEFSKIMNVMDLLSNTQYQINMKEISLNKVIQSTTSSSNKNADPIWEADVSFDVLSQQ